MKTKLSKMRIFFAWYDFWIGVYWDRKRRILFCCPFPTVVIALYFAPPDQP